MVDLFLSILVFFLPISTLIFFVVSLVLFIVGRVKNKKVPGSIKTNRLNRDRILLIVSSVMVAVEVLLIVVFVIALSRAISYM